MDATTQALIADLITHKIVENWVFWLLFFVFSGLATLTTSFFKAFGSKRGEQLATRADFDTLKVQLQATTRLTEEIKNEVGHIEWRIREAYSTRRAKLEEFVQQIGTVSSTLDPWISSLIVGETFVAQDTECLNRLEMLARLYFPPLYGPTMGLTLAWRNLNREALAATQALAQIGHVDLEGRRRQIDANLAAYQPLNLEVLTRRTALEQTVVNTMQDILGLTDEPRRDQQNQG
jgi:hypothetical protein